MKIAITANKGGVTKSTQGKEIALKFDLKVFDLDKASHLKEKFKMLKVDKVEENTLIPFGDDCIYDFPGGDIFSLFPNTTEILKECDLIIIPTLYVPESIDRAIDTYNKVKPINDKILFILSQMREEEYAKDTIQYMQDILGEEIVLHPIRFSLGMENAEFDGTSIYEVANKANKLIKRNYYNGIIKDYEELFKLINEVI